MLSDNKHASFLIPDIPASEDEFGVHENIANSIVDLVMTEDGGRTVSIEGKWGSGKSTIINLIRKKFSDNPTKLVFLFDAWTHQGDPLRRTFLETLIAFLI